MSKPEPSTDGTPPHGRSRRLTPEQREEIIRRIKLGERPGVIARDFGVTAEAVSQIRIRLLPIEERRPSMRRSQKRLRDDELRMLTEAVGGTLPADHGFEILGPEHRRRWTDTRIRALSMKLAGRVPAVRVLKELIEVGRLAFIDDGDGPPEYPLPHDVRRLSPELAADEEFVEYYLSPAAWELALRQYDYQVREYEKEVAGRSRPPAEPPPVSQPASEPASTKNAERPPAPGGRLGKHGKGSPFTKPKRRKRR